MKQSDFYARENTQPFRRDLSNRRRYFEQRDSLQRQLGIVPHLLAGARILEFGPGHGENALFLLSQNPSILELVEISEECALAAKALLERHCPSGTTVHCHLMGIDEYQSDKPFDLVVFEGVIPFEPDPPALLLQTAEFVAPGGLLSITCIDAVSLFSEALRRLIGLIVAPPDLQTPERIARLLPIFSPHLDTLPGMTRAHEDWILDQMIHPWSGRSLSILDAARTLAPEFDLYGSSPAFLTDWRWFRDVCGDRGYLELAEASYFQNVHNLIDYRHARPQQSTVDNQHLLEMCDGVLDGVRDFEETGEGTHIDRIKGDVASIETHLHTSAPETAASLADYLAILDGLQGDQGDFKFGRFAPLFGRGQQYASFLRQPVLPSEHTAQPHGEPDA